MTDYTPKDFRGKEIKIGDTIVYPVRRRSNMYLKEATVMEITGVVTPDKKNPHQIIIAVNDKGRRLAITAVERCVVVRRMFQPVILN